MKNNSTTQVDKVKKNSIENEHKAYCLVMGGLCVYDDRDIEGTIHPMTPEEHEEYLRKELK